jgi:hypothetical protein
MKPKLLSISLVASLLAVLPLTAQIIFQDNFNNGGSTTTNLNTNLSSRQSGAQIDDIGTVNWVAGSAGNLTTTSYQNRQSELQTNLGGNLSLSGRITAYADANFGSYLAGNTYRFEYMMAVELFTSGGNPVSDLNVNVTDFRFLLDTTVAHLTSGSSGDWDLAVRFTPRATGGNYFLRPVINVGGVAVSGLTDIAFNPVQIGTEWFSPLTNLSIVINESANLLSVFYGVTAVLDNHSIAGVMLTTDRHFGFAATRTDSAPTTTALQHKVDDFSLSIIPEPSTFALAIGFMALGATCFGRGRRARR